MRDNSMIKNILMLVGLLFAGGIILSIVMGLLSGILWFAVKILVPVAIAVWLVRLVSNPSRKCRRHY